MLFGKGAVGLFLMFWYHRLTWFSPGKTVAMVGITLIKHIKMTSVSNPFRQTCTSQQVKKEATIVKT